MNMTKKMVLAAVVLPLTLGTASVFAYGGGKGQYKRSDDECGRGADRGIMQQLDLTADQQAKLKEMRGANRDQMKNEFKGQKQAQMQAHHAKVQALVLADNFDEAAANELAKEMVDQQVSHRVKMLEKRHDMLSVLTPEQKVKFQELQQERMQKCMANGPKKMKKNG
ncbi:CpxP family protein [Vibrio sp. S12_S33]|uniref:CpxP family protein n=1 Tax=Vibrio sp. S12_S33 TaxID=2720223 RepID=UPI0017811875|nr:CpxP family protein [Vibrio sp. S12_S33]MBD1564591.1 CpxP family protein [Vibrio sp. S12_S33]